MNFLAHIYLSGDHEEVKIGNFLGDFVKGKELEKYNASVQDGIRLHRRIDEYTDNHPVVMESKQRLRGEFGHYAPVVADVFYDHFLAADWATYSSVPLLDYTVSFYQLTDKYRQIIPDRARHMLKYMKRDNWLLHYGLIQGIDRALTGMSQRTKFQSNMENAAKELSANFDEYRSEFEMFFPDLEQECANFLAENGYA